jgi:hypothetical protein
MASPNLHGINFLTLTHNGPKTEIDDRYIRGLCHNLGLDEKELRRRL